MLPIRKSATPGPAATLPGALPFENRYTAGECGENFLRGLKEEQTILGTWCPKCEEILVPAAYACERCHARLVEYRPVGPEGTLHSFTRVDRDHEGKPLDKPVVLAFVTFEGARGGILHYLEGADPKRLSIGARVEAIFKPAAEREASILDIAHFALVTE